jgi:hypothetical protein
MTVDTVPTSSAPTVLNAGLTFYAVPGTWSYRATTADHTYTLTIGVGDEPMWTTTIDHADPVVHDTLDDAVSALLEHRAPFAAA